MVEPLTPFRVLAWHNTEYVDVKKKHMSFHSHNTLELYYVQEGVARVDYVESKTGAVVQKYLSSRQFILVKPYVSHSINQHSDQMKVYNLELILYGESTNIMSALSNSLYVNKFPDAVKLLKKWTDVAIFTDNQNLAHILRKFRHYDLEKNDILFFASLEIDLKRLFLEILQCSLETIKLQGSVVHVKNALVYLESYYANDITLKKVADSVGVSQSYLQKLFKEYFHKSIMQYLNDIRLKKAKRLLMETNLNVLNVAKSCGFNSLQAFGKSFRKEMGVSPTQFRESELTQHIRFFLEDPDKLETKIYKNKDLF